MSKLLALAFAITGLAVISSSAQAYWVSDLSEASTAQPRHERAYHGHQGYRTARHSGGGHISGTCWQAARMGGPCGCEAAKIAFGEPVRNLWLVSNWFQFPRTNAHVGAAAIWGHHHVEIVTAVNGDGTVNTTGSVGFSHVPISRLAFVEPQAGVHRRRHG